MLVSNVSHRREKDSPGMTATGVLSYPEMRAVGILPGVKRLVVGSGWLIGTEMVI